MCSSHQPYSCFKHEISQPLLLLGKVLKVTLAPKESLVRLVGPKGTCAWAAALPERQLLLSGQSPAPQRPPMHTCFPAAQAGVSNSLAGGVTDPCCCLIHRVA